ncbi:MAG TPA: outer membrane protein transport protein [Chitinophagaceae bacterium]|nr:outer membrane protein transport protein [Chitinophagaceae bacterium]
MKRRLLWLCLLLGPSVHIYAGGFKVSLQGIKQIGMAGTGVGFASDAAAIYYNPSGISFVPRQINIGVNGLFPSTSFLEKNTNNLYHAANHMFTPFSVYAHTALSKRWSAGIGIYTPFGTGVAYPADWSGRYILRKINLETVFIQPTLSFKVNRNFSLGGGFIYAVGTMLLSKDIPITSGSENYIANAELRGNASGTGFNAGATLKAGDRLQFGITYHSMVKMKVSDGEAVFSNIPVGLKSNFPSPNTFTTSLKLPAEFDFGFSYQLKHGFYLLFDYNRTFWNVFDSLGFDYGVNTSTVTDAKSPRLYENSSCFRLGAQAECSPRIDLRAGIFFDQSPVPDGYVAPELPDNHKTGITLGGTFRVDERTHLDISLLYEEVAKRTQRNKETGLEGTFQTKVLAPGIGVTYLFQKRISKKKRY